MLNRRLVIAGAIAVSCGCSRPSIAQSINEFSDDGGCTISASKLSKLADNNSEFVSYLHGNEPIIYKSGNAMFDRALAQSLARMTKLFGVLPGFGYYQEEPGDGPNAYASSAVRMEKTDGTVLFGMQLLSAMMNQPEAPDAAVLSVCAHEYGHILANKYNLRLNDGQSTVRRNELFADFMAGYYAGHRKMENANFAAAVFATTQASAGDTNFNSRGHHGTPQERGAAVVKGYQTAKMPNSSLTSAISAGVAYVQS